MHEEIGQAEFAQLVEQALAAEYLVMAVIVKPAAWQRFGLKPCQNELVRSLVPRRPTVLVLLGKLHVLDDYPSAEVRLCSGSGVPVSQRALFGLLAGDPLDPAWPGRHANR